MEIKIIKEMIRMNIGFIIIMVIFIILIQGFIVYSGINIFGTTIINIKELIIIFLISISIIPVDFIRKCIIKKLRGNIGV